eukprot:9166266-Karenia_brevis.AAC.1
MDDIIDEEMCTDAIRILKVATAVVIDRWSPADLGKLLNKALRQLAYILQQVEEWATWPSSLLYNIIGLLGEPQGGPDP